MVVLLFLIIPMFGIMLTVSGIKGLNRYKELPKVEAKIIDFRKKRGKHGTMYAPVYSYAFNGEYIEEAASTLYDSRKPDVGQTEEIAVDPESPEVPIVKGKYISMIVISIPFIATAVPIILIIIQNIIETFNS